MTAPNPTPRLILRPWRESDLAPFAAINADPVVMRFFPAPLSREESNMFTSRIMARLGVRHKSEFDFDYSSVPGGPALSPRLRDSEFVP